MTVKIENPQRALGVVLGALTAAIQIHTTLPIGPIGIRISVADLAIPMVLILAVYAAHHISAGLELRRIWVPLAFLAASSLWLAISILHGRLDTGYWQSWALLNRGAGWLIVLAFFAAGWAYGRIIPEISSFWITWPYLAFFWFSCAFSAAVMVALTNEAWGLLAISEPDASAFQQTMGMIAGKSRFQGLMVNPNAFGFTAAIAIVLHLAYVRETREIRWHATGVAISITGLLWSYSRGAWLAAAVGLGFLLLARRLNFRVLVSAVIVASILSVLLWQLTAAPVIQTQNPLANVTGPISGGQSIGHRLVILERAVDLWREAPIAGSGVGSFIHRQSPSPAEPIATIHTSYIWLLTETGIIGLVLFAGLFLSAFIIILRAAHERASESLFFATAAILVVFGVQAFTMEVLYQRPLWLFLGAALGLASYPQKN